MFISSSGRINNFFPNYQLLLGYPLWAKHNISQFLLHGEKSSFPNTINNNRRYLLLPLPNSRFTIIQREALLHTIPASKVNLM